MSVAQSNISDVAARLRKLDVNINLTVEDVRSEAKNLDEHELEDLVHSLNQDLTDGLKSLIHHQILYLLLTFASPNRSEHLRNRDFIRLIRHVMVDIGGDLILLLGMVGDRFAKESKDYQKRQIGSFEWNWTVSKQNMIWHRNPNEAQLALDQWNLQPVVNKTKLFNDLPSSMFRKLSHAYYRALGFVRQKNVLAPILNITTQTFEIMRPITGVAAEVCFSAYPLRPGYAETTFSDKLTVEL